MVLETPIGRFHAQSYAVPWKRDTGLFFQQIPYARAGRFEKPVMIEHYGDVFPGRPCCFPQPKVPAMIHVFLQCPLMRPEFLNNKELQSEDAFNLNIWTPDSPGKKPVLVYIHGGGLENGSSSTAIYDGSALALEGLVVVTFNYRLSALGYMPIDENSVNLCFYDQHTALAWVKKHIALFGGDNENITLMGQSAGALSAFLQFLSPKNAGLFHKVILASGAQLTPLTPAAAIGNTKKAYAKKGLSIENARTTSLGKLARTKMSPLIAGVIDGDFLTAAPEALLKSGHFPKIPVLVGTTEDEMSMIESPLYYGAMGIVRHRSRLKEKLQRDFGALFDEVTGAFPLSGDVVDTQFKIMELLIFHTEAYQLLEHLSAHTHVTGYRFGYRPNLYNEKRGSYHGSEVAMFFNNLYRMHIKVRQQDMADVRRLQEEWLGWIHNRSTLPLYNEKKHIRYYENHGVASGPFPMAGLIDKLKETDIPATMLRSYMKNR
jgi:para-nitrobenzyl esterase